MLCNDLNLTAHQEEIMIKRIKLNYDEIAPCCRSASDTWNRLMLSENAAATSLDYSTLADAVENGVSKQSRGDVWRLLVDWRNSCDDRRASHRRQTFSEDGCCYSETIDYNLFPLADVPYEQLLRELTSHQHLIIIDLGRTFPTHMYFAASLGPGQLALYNLLKAYSLLDAQVGYCQGLSFIAGVLLLHLDERDAYCLLRHLMLQLGLRRQYLPDMAALQVQLYQIARLLRDSHRDLYEHLEGNEVNPSLYAAPWFLTLFASQFPIGFVVRVFGKLLTVHLSCSSHTKICFIRHIIAFNSNYCYSYHIYIFVCADLIFLNGLSMVFRIGLSILADHKDMLLQCRNFEQLMDYFKTTIPSMGASQLERVVGEVHFVCVCSAFPL